jgi:hypothetical protein
MSVDETNTVDALTMTRRIAREQLDLHGGWLFGLPGDGIFALFESAVDAVKCALETQQRLLTMSRLSAMRLRIGVHLGEVVFQDGLPYGEALVIAARLESHAEPGGVLVSAAVMDAVAPRIAAQFSERGVFNLKHSPRRITTYSVSVDVRPGDLDLSSTRGELLDRTILSVPGSWKPEGPPVAETAGPGGPTSHSHPRPGDGAIPVPAEPVPHADPMQPAGMPAPVQARSDPAASAAFLPEAAFPAPIPPRPDPIPATVSLPKATPLVVRSPTAQAEPDQGEEGSHGALTATAAEIVLSPDCAAAFIEALTRHIGPVAGVLVRRLASHYADPLAFIDALADEIPAEGERAQFRAKARQVIARQPP